MAEKSTTPSHDPEITLPDKFNEFIADYLTDLNTTFPEYKNLWSRWENSAEDNLKTLFAYFLTVFPERFFDIIYQNDDIFSAESSVNTFFLPDVDFKILYNTPDLTESIKKTIWKYLQIILFSAVNSVKDKSGFGEAMNMFEGIDEKELQEKLQETMQGVEAFFKSMGGDGGDSGVAGATAEGEQKPPSQNFDFKDMNMPNPEQMHEHLRGLFDGKIGKLAKEMAEEITKDLGSLGLDGNTPDTPENAQNVLKNLMKNPEKMMGIVKKVGSKLNDKMKSGEITQEEIMREAGDLMSKMKEMGGGADIGEMMKKMARQMAGGGGGGDGMPGMPDAAKLAEMMAKMGRGAKMDTNAMNNMVKKQTMKDKMRARLEVKKQQAAMVAAATAAAQQQQNINSAYFEGNTFKIPGETQAKSSLPMQHTPEDLDKIIADLGLGDTKAEQHQQQQQQNKKKTKKGKK